MENRNVRLQDGEFIQETSLSDAELQIPSSRVDGTDSVRIENDATIFASVKSSVTPKEQEDSSFPHRAPKAERIM